jgi:hypothetical protein
VKPFIDITGASGAVYRFRRVAALSQFPATAETFVPVRRNAGTPERRNAGTPTRTR